jgi:hypothetical protein
MRNAVVSRNAEGKSSPGRPKNGWKGNSEIYLEEILYELWQLDCKHLTHKRLLWTLSWISLVQKWRTNPWQAKILSDSHEGVCCMVSATYWVLSVAMVLRVSIQMRTARREIALVRGTSRSRGEVDSDNLYVLLLLLLCTTSVGFSASEGGKPTFSLYDCVKIWWEGTEGK